MNNENITSKLEYQNNLMTKGPMPHKMHYNLHIIADFSKENTQEHLGAPPPKNRRKNIFEILGYETCVPNLLPCEVLYKNTRKCICGEENTI